MIVAALVVAVAVAADVPRPDLTGAPPPVFDGLSSAAAAVEREPTRAAAWGEYAMMLQAHNCPVQAAVAYASAQRLDPDDFRWAYFQAILLMKTDPAAALAQFDRAIEIDPDYAAAHIRRGIALQELGRDDEAAQALARALELEPANVSAYVHAGQIALKRKEIESAISHLETARRSRPRDSMILSVLAQAYARLGDRARARELAAMSRECFPGRIVDDARLSEVVLKAATLQAFLDRADVLFDERLFEAGHRELQRALDLGHDPGVIHSVRAHQFLVAGNAERSVAAAEAALAAGHDEAALEALYAQALVRLGRLEQAEAVLRRRTEADAPEGVVLRVYAEVAAARGEDALAIERWTRSLEIEDDRGARRQRAVARWRLGDREAARVELTDLARKATHDTKTWIALGDVHRALGDDAEALAAYDRAALNATTAGAGRRAVAVLRAQGRYAEVEDRLRALRVRWPRNPTLINELAWLLATCPDDGIRDGAEAAALIRPLVQTTRSREPAVLDTLAAAQAETGDYAEAVRTMEQALALLDAEAAPARRASFEARRDRYAAGQPWREVPLDSSQQPETQNKGP